MEKKKLRFAPMTFAEITLIFRRVRLPLTPRARAFDRLSWAAAVCLILFVMAPGSRRSFPCDFYQFWVAGQALKTMPVTDIYSHQDRQAAIREFQKRAASIRSSPLRGTTMGLNHLDFTATPLLLASLDAVSSGDLETDLKRFRVLSALLYGFGILALAAALRFSGFWTLMFLVVFTKFFWPYQMNMMVVNVSALQAGAFLLILALLRDASPARLGLIGLLLGLLTVLKPTIAPAAAMLMVSFAADRRWPEAAWYGAGLAVAALLGLAIPWFSFGTACTWLAWRESVPHVLFTGWWLTGGFLGKLIGLRNPIIFAGFSAALMLAASVVIVRSRHRPGLRRRIHWVWDAGAAALGALIALLSSPIVHSHYFVVAIPAALIALRPDAISEAVNARRTALGFLAMFLLAAHPLIQAAGLTRWPNHSLWTFLGVWILAGLLIDQRGKTHQGHP